MARWHVNSIAHGLSATLLASFLALSVTQADEGNAEPIRDSYLEITSPLVRVYCFDCHSGDKPSGGVSLDKWSGLQSAIQNSAEWARIRRVLDRHEMPPSDATPLPEDHRAAIVQWIDSQVLHVDCEHPDPGYVPVRRLSRREYRNTVRDLTGVDFPADEEFPVDNAIHGFDNIAEAMTISPLLLEKYFAAAETIADQAIICPEERGSSRTRFAPDLLEVGYNAKHQGDGLVALTPYEEDDLTIRQSIEVPGDYLLRVSALGKWQPHPWEKPKPEDDDPTRPKRPLELTFLLDDEPIRTIFLAPSFTEYGVRVRIESGRRKLRVAMRKYKDGLSPDEARIWKSGEVQRGVIFVEWLELEGPIDPKANDVSISHRLILGDPADPSFLAAPGSRADFEMAARPLLSRFARRAFRRPVSSEEVAKLVALAKVAWDKPESFERGIELAVQGVLSSPNFLFRGEREAVPRSADSPEKFVAKPMDEFALASRLSYFLWSTMPDGELFSKAETGKLRTDLPAQIERMLQSEKAKAFTTDFAGQWLELRNLDTVQPHDGKFADFGEPLRLAMRKETELLFEKLVRENRSVMDLLLADYTFANERLAKHYGLAGVTGPEFREVSLVDTPRRGVLSHASFLTITSNPTRTSPVKRGKWVLENLLNLPPPPPPPNVPELEKATAREDLSLREKMELHRQNAMCASCHQKMDPLGFAFEHYDAIGAWRDQDGDVSIDASGKLVSGESFADARELTQILATSKREEFVRCFAEKLLTYAINRGLEPFDRCAIDEIVQKSKQQEYRVQSFVRAVIESAPFQQIRVGESPRP